MKKLFLVLALFCGVISFGGCACNNTNALPKPELDTSYMGIQFGLDANINIETIDNYLFRNDVVYRDMRMLYDPATYGNLEGGDQYLSGFVKGFEVVPFPYLAPVEGLPEVVTNAYNGPTLFSHIDGVYVANYEESMDILEYLFPKDKAIFLMCGGGGYAGSTRAMLISLGWDEEKLYNVGGYWYYTGDNNVQVKRVVDENTIKYDFYKVSYHMIDFDELTLNIGE